MKGPVGFKIEQTKHGEKGRMKWRIVRSRKELWRGVQQRE